MALLTAVEMQSLRDIGKRVDEDKLNEAIRLTEYGELYDLLGDFVHDVVKNKDEASYADLMDGSEFTCNGDLYTHQGLKSMFADLVYARYIRTINVNITPFGATVKNDDNSQPAFEDKLRDMANQARKDADSKFVVIKKYLEENSDTFGRFYTGENPDLAQGKVRVSTI